MNSKSNQFYVNTIRRWLTENKIFFETIAASLLSVMAIIVSLVQLDIASKQTQLLNLQTKIALQQILPQFVIKAVQILDETGYASDDRLIIKNVGGIVKELKSEHAVFFEVEIYFRGGLNGDPVTLEIPITGYYDATMHNPEGQGKVITLIGYKNNQRAAQIERDFRKYTEAKGLYGFIQIHRYVRLIYKDMLGDEHVDYYFVPLIYGAHLLSQEEGRTIFETYKQSIRDGKILEFDKLTSAQILERVQK